MKKNLLLEEQKNFRRRTRRTKDQLLIHKPVVRSSRSKTNLNVAWIDLRNAHDMVPHSWIMKTLELVETATNIIELLIRSMQNWRMVLFSGKNKLETVYFKVTLCHSCYLWLL